MKFHKASEPVAKITVSNGTFYANPLLESTQYALFPEWEAPCYQNMRFFPSENAVTTSCLHEGAVEGFIEDLRKII